MLSHSVSNGENLLFFFFGILFLDLISMKYSDAQCCCNVIAITQPLLRFFFVIFINNSLCVCVYISSIYSDIVYICTYRIQRSFIFFSVFRYNNNSNNCVFRVDSLNFTTGGIEFHLVHHYQRFDVRHRHQHPHHRHRHSHSHQLSMFLLVSH